MSVPRDVTMKNCVAYTTRPFLLRLALAVGIVLLGALVCRAGGPKYVAGTSYFDPGVRGQPLTWSQGVITYYTDQGSLSPLLSNSSANSFVASAFSVWTSVSTAALVANNGGSLAEDVNGTNVTVNADGTGSRGDLIAAEELYRERQHYIIDERAAHDEQDRRP